jgi:hypothetical protein
MWANSPPLGVGSYLSDALGEVVVKSWGLCPDTAGKPHSLLTVRPPAVPETSRPRLHRG